jgi:hypothetical protein
VKSLSRGWIAFLAFSAIAGLLLRTLFVQDMEYKEDEEFNFIKSQTEGWPWSGMPSGVFIPNPGMSVWAFRALALLARTTHPTELMRALSLWSWLGIALLLPFILYALRPGDDRRPWLWAMALAFVNPFAVLYQRKLWPEPFLPTLSVLALMGWWRRDRWLGAFAWGLIGACLGQIHMSGFFLSAGFVLATLLFQSLSVPRARVRWSGWFAGSTLGALPLIPWALETLRQPRPESVGQGWTQIVQLKFWVFWLTDSLGLHLGNPLGLLRGQSTWAQISDFVRYPILGGQPTYLNAIAHAVALGAGATILGKAGNRLAARIRAGRGAQSKSKAAKSDASIAFWAALWGFGVLLTLSSVNIRRYYMMVAFPLEFAWLASLAYAGSENSDQAPQRSLALLWTAQLFTSACFVGYVHVNEGATQGDYGEAFHVVMRKRSEGAPVPDYPTLRLQTPPPASSTPLQSPHISGRPGE